MSILAGHDISTLCGNECCTIMANLGTKHSSKLNIIMQTYLTRINIITLYLNIVIILCRSLVIERLECM